ncbi:MAG: GNAT family N-acetyltransferase [Acidobacteriota bacterium]|nr:GNAT family N-acetyltransferase [Acidobacteriota bacterium]
MRVRKATSGDAADLAAFGRRAFHTTFASENNPDDLEQYLDTAYTEDRQRAEILDPAIETLLIEQDGTLAAFAQIREGPVPACITGPDPIELWRFYVDHSWHGRGVSAALMGAVEDTVRSRGARTLWLGVWERNARAQAFYRKHGFTVAGAQIFVVGSDPQRDFVMVKPVPGATRR